MYTNRRQPVNTVGIKQLRDNLSRILKMVENGQVVTVLRHGREVVQLKPVIKNREKDLLARLREKRLSQGVPVGHHQEVIAGQGLKLAESTHLGVVSPGLGAQHRLHPARRGSLA